MKFDRDFEEDILSCCMRDTAYLKSAARLLEAHHFHSPQHAWVWKALADTWGSFRERTTLALMLAKSKRDYTDDDERKGVIELVKRIAERKPKAGMATLEELTRFVKAVDAQTTLEAGARALEKGDIDEVYEALKRLSRKNVEPRQYDHQAWIEMFDDRMADRKYRKEHPEEFPRVPTGFKRLDHILSGGLEVTEVGMVLGTTGRGKSICLANMCYSGVIHGIPSVYFSMEMPAEQIAMRHDARWLKMAYRKLKEYDFKPSELREIKEKLEKFKKKFGNMLHIISTPMRKCNVDMIYGALDDLKAQYGFRPKAIYLDSADHMSPVNQNRKDEFRLQQAAVYWDIATLADEEGFAIWTTTHAGREWAEKIAEAESASESYDKARIVDCAISLNVPKKKSRTTTVKEGDEAKDSEEGETVSGRKLAGSYLEMRLAKYRDGKSKVTIPIDADFARMYLEEIDETEEGGAVEEEKE